MGHVGHGSKSVTHCHLCSRHFNRVICTLQVIQAVIQFYDRDSKQADQHVHNYADNRIRSNLVDNRVPNRASKLNPRSFRSH